MTDHATHAERIRDQFTRQATPFAAFPIHSQEESLVWLRDELHLSGGERVLDAGCGPGLVACSLARSAGSVVGIDATPAMLAAARDRAAQAGLSNATFHEGLMERLPFDDAMFDAVVTRYTFHHLLEPAVAMAELVRVCRPGGRVVICDAAPRTASQQAYDAWERLRDPSHTSALTPEQLRGLAERFLDEVRCRGFRLATTVDGLIAASCPPAGAADDLRRRMQADVGCDALDMGASIVDGILSMSFPVLIVAGTNRRSGPDRGKAAGSSVNAEWMT